MRVVAPDKSGKTVEIVIPRAVAAEGGKAIERYCAEQLGCAMPDGAAELAKRQAAAAKEAAAAAKEAAAKKKGGDG